MGLIGFEKRRKYADPYLAPVAGRRGNCVLCGHFGQLTETHILPRSAGNRKDLLANSFLAAVSAGKDELRARRFRNGISFWTLCSDCNNRLGAKEDKEISELYDRVAADLGRGVILPPTLKYVVRPNLLIRGILAHIASANDPGARTSFDQEVSDIFRQKKSLRDSRLKIYYWPYLGDRQLIVRDAAMARFSLQDAIWMQVLKMAPLGFVVTDAWNFFGFPCLNFYRTDRDEEENEIPLILEHIETHPHWPAGPTADGVTLFSANCMGLVARPR